MGTASWRPDVSFLLDMTSDPNDPTALESWDSWTSKLLKASGIRRGRPYVLDKNTAGAPTFDVLDVDEYLNADNPSSPYVGSILPYRKVAFQAMWPNTTVGNLLNTGAVDPETDDGGNPTVNCAYDPILESTTVGTQPLWVWATTVGSAPVVSTTVAWQGSRSLRWTKVSADDGVLWHVPCIPGRQYTTSVYVRQDAAGTIGMVVDSPKGSATAAVMTDVGSWVRLSLTFTAWRLWHEVSLTAQGTMTAGFGYVDGFQHEQAAAASTFTATGPVLYTVFNGSVEEFPRAWRHAGLMGWSGIKCTDALGILNRFKIDTEVKASIRATRPDYWWPLGEPDGTTLWGEQSGNTGLSMEKTQSPWGVVGVAGIGGTVESGIASGIAGDPDGRGVQMVSGGGYTHGYGLLAGNAANPVSAGGDSASWGLTVQAWITTQSNPWPDSRAIPIALYGPGNAYAYIDISGTGSYVNFWTGNSSGYTYAAWNSFTPDDLVHHVVGVMAVSSGTMTNRLYWDGILVDSHSWSCVTEFGTATPGMKTDRASVGMMWWQEGSQAVVGDGIHSHAAIWNRELSATEVGDLYNSGRGGVGETSGARIERYIGYSWNGGTAIDAGRSVMGVNSLAKKTELLVACQDVQDSENGDFFADRHGYIRFHGRDRRYRSTTPVVVFGEDVAAGEMPYTENITFGMDRMRIYNEVTVINSGGVTSVRTDETSQRRFFPNSYERKVNLASDGEAVSFADWILFTNKDPRQRVSGITLNPVSHPNLWPIVLRLELGDRVTVKRRPKGANAGAGLVMSTDYFIEQIEHTNIDMEAGTWQVNLSLSRVDVNPLIFDDPNSGFDVGCSFVY